MSRGGRRPTPTALLKLRGSFNSTRDARDRASEPITIGDLGEPPFDLTDEQQAEWTYAVEHAPRDVLRLIDRNILRAWCEESVRHKLAMAMQTAQDQRSRYKLLVKTPNGWRPSPYLDVMDKAAMAMIRLARELGFSPASRPSLKADPPVIEAKAEPELRTDPWKFLETDRATH